MKIAIFPGSFDPFTIGHKDIVERTLPLFDKIIIAIGNNSEKNTLFSVEERKEKIANAFKNNKKISVEEYTGLTIDFAKQNNAQFIIRGARNTIDFEYEKQIADFNKQEGDIETIILFTNPQYAYISSTLCRDLIKNGKDISKLTI
ncbi:MAG: pantetheine-phosphate adenylyltransferase [Paludibacteraceae bacterium]|nr:pantetheine-phosphate adenylyltransferase [Paludibacteraceae bacterium]